MKFRIYILAAMATLSLAACDGSYDDWADPQGFAPEAERAINFSAAGIGKTINLMTDTATLVPVASYQAPTASDSATVVYQLKLFNAAKASRTISLTKDGTAHRDTLNNAVIALYGKDLKERDMKGLVYAYTKINGQAVYGRSDSIAVNVSPAAPYLIYPDYSVKVGDATVSMRHEGTENVYDAPTFTATFQVKTANAQWQIADGSSNVTLAPATDATALSGTLAEGKTGTIGETGWYKLTVNMYTRAYTLEKLTIPPYLWVPGNQQGWAPATASQLYTTNMDMVYTGFIYLNGEFKFTSKAGWDGTNYGYSADGVLSTDGGAKNLSAAEGFYFISANTQAMTYQLTLINTVSLIGSSVGGWDKANDVDMTYNKTTNSYSITTNLAVGELKFRMNHDWAINLGGETSALTVGGGNLKIAEAGTYTITVYPTYDGNSHCSIVKK